MTHTSRTSVRGFTLVETLVAIAILMIALVGPFYAIQQAITTSYVARDQLIASQLSQEGEEFIYFLRDKNYLSTLNWMNGLDACFGTYGCVVDPSQASIGSCGSTGCAPLTQNPANGLYGQNISYPQTRFTRTVHMKYLNANQVEVKVTVTWITSHRNLSVESVEELYNWL